MVYVADRRRWLGGLRSAHAIVDAEPLPEEGRAIALGPETHDALVPAGRRGEEVRVERLC
jgi:hypothetical protein